MGQAPRPERKARAHGEKAGPAGINQAGTGSDNVGNGTELKEGSTGATEFVPFRSRPGQP